MAKLIILLVVLLLLLLIIALFSINLNIVFSFFASTEEERLYKYAISVRNSAPVRALEFEFYRASDTDQKKKPQKKKKKGTRIWEKFRTNLKKYKPYVEIDDLSFKGQISFGYADKTALAAGALNSLAGVITALLGIFASKVTLHCIDIRPVYDNDFQCNFLFECILKCNTGNIIITTLNILKGSNKNVKSHKRCHVDSDEQHKRNGGCKHSDRRRCANA